MSANDVASLLLRAARGIKRLDPDSERELIVRYRAGDGAALGILVIGHVRFVVSRAHRLRGYEVPVEDLIQEGLVGLLEAALRFDVDREVRFSTYADAWVKSAMHEFVLRNWSIVRGPMTAEQKALFFRLRGMKARLMRDPAASPSMVRAAIAAALGVPLSEVERMDTRLATGDVRLNAPVPWDEDGHTEIGDNLADPATLGDDLMPDFLDEDARSAELRSALASLDQRERLIIEERWIAEQVAPLNALGEWFGISVDKVRRIEIAAIIKLRTAMVPRVGRLVNLGT